MPPPPAEPLAARIFLGPALRTQPDRRLVKLVREGYETAFEEIVRRYRKPLDRFAAAIVGGHSEDVTQDAFSKALLALRGSEAEIELRPWLYRIVRNTALNDLRDRPPATEQLGEAMTGGRSAAGEAERREEMSELMERLRALPEPQRAAIVMRELEGLSHEEIAAALGVSGGAARQAIYRARAALRDGLGLLVPLPLLRVLFDHGAEAAGAGGAAAAGATSAAAAGTGTTLGGLGAAGALKVGVAAVLVAGSVGAGVAIQNHRGADAKPASASELRGGEAVSGGSQEAGDDPQHGGGGGRGGGHGSDDSGRGGDGHGGNRGPGSGTSGGNGDRGSSHGDSGAGPGGSSGHGGSGSGDGGGGGTSGDSHGGGSGGGGSSSGHGGDSGTSDGSSSTTSPPPPAEALPEDGGGSHSGGGADDS